MLIGLCYVLFRYCLVILSFMLENVQLFHMWVHRYILFFWYPCTVNTILNINYKVLKVTVQFETEGNGPNEIFSHTDRSVKIFFYFDTHTHNEILKQKFHRKWV